MKPINRYHIRMGTKRTTISLDTMLSTLLALKLQHQPHTLAAHMAIRNWLQEQIDRQNDPDRTRTSQWLQGEAFLAIADKKLSEEYFDWLLSES